MGHSVGAFLLSDQIQVIEFLAQLMVLEELGDDDWRSIGATYVFSRPREAVNDRGASEALKDLPHPTCNVVLVEQMLDRRVRVQTPNGLF
jgi:hypothetical protein